MYISCPKCQAKFVVSANQIGHDGRKVKCSKCKHSWHQTLDSLKEAVAQIEPQPTLSVGAANAGEGPYLPALRPAGSSRYLLIMPFILLLAIGALLMVLFPANFGIDSLIEQKSLSINDVQINTEPEFDKITISYKVLNSSSDEKQMPLVRIRLLDKNHRMLKAHIVDRSDIKLSPRQYAQIKTEFVPGHRKTEIVDIMIGNKLDFYLR